MIIKGYIFTYLYIFLIIGFSTLIYKDGKGNITRKIIHIGVAFYYFIAYKYFGSSIHVIIPPITFIIINYLSYKKELVKSMEEEKSPGTIYYAISVFILALISYLKPDFYPYFGIGLMVMGLGDGLAPIFAGLIKSKKIYKDKTLTGSLTVFVVSLIVVIVFNILFGLDLHIGKIIIISGCSLILELFGKKGLDNLTLPIGVALVSWILGVI